MCPALISSGAGWVPRGIQAVKPPCRTVAPRAKCGTLAGLTASNAPLFRNPSSSQKVAFGENDRGAGVAVRMKSANAVFRSQHHLVTRRHSGPKLLS
jgi:hypothetical protein